MRKLEVKGEPIKSQKAVAKLIKGLEWSETKVQTVRTVKASGFVFFVCFFPLNRTGEGQRRENLK